MCTLVLLRRPDASWPLLIAANRDEMAGRDSAPPARHWPDRPETIAGLDRMGGGSWLGLNDRGLMAAVMNRTGTLGPEAGKRSRGELVLETLDHAEADAAAGALADLDPHAYRPFNLAIADPRRAYWLRHGGDGEIRVHPIPVGLHMLCATELDDPGHPRIARYLPRFLAAAVPQPQTDTWEDWRRLLASTETDPTADPESAMVVARADGFATRSSALIALPAYPSPACPPRWLHADGRPDRVAFRPVDLSG